MGRAFTYDETDAVHDLHKDPDETAAERAAYEAAELEADRDDAALEAAEEWRGIAAAAVARRMTVNGRMGR